MLALNGADQLNGPRQWGSLLFCLVIVLSLQRAEGSTEETGSSYTKIRILPSILPPQSSVRHRRCCSDKRSRWPDRSIAGNAIGFAHRTDHDKAARRGPARL